MGSKSSKSYTSTQPGCQEIRVDIYLFRGTELLVKESVVLPRPTPLRALRSLVRKKLNLKGRPFILQTARVLQPLAWTHGVVGDLTDDPSCGVDVILDSDFTEMEIDCSLDVCGLQFRQSTYKASIYEGVDVTMKRVASEWGLNYDLCKFREGLQRHGNAIAGWQSLGTCYCWDDWTSPYVRVAIHYKPATPFDRVFEDGILMNLLMNMSHPDTITSIHAVAAEKCLRDRILTGDVTNQSLWEVNLQIFGIIVKSPVVIRLPVSCSERDVADMAARIWELEEPLNLAIVVNQTDGPLSTVTAVYKPSSRDVELFHYADIRSALRHARNSSPDNARMIQQCLALPEGEPPFLRNEDGLNEQRESEELWSLDQSPFELDAYESEIWSQMTHDRSQIGCPKTEPLAESGLVDELAGDGEESCIVCMENKPNMVHIPCGHLGHCNRCSSKLEHCPVCKTLIVSRVRVYKP
jgi:hypothetical protein